MHKNRNRNFIFVLGLSFFTSLLWVLTKGRMVNGDEAVVGLMALKISRGVDFPFFFWKAHYSGPIASYMAAPLHLLWEPSGILLHSVLIPMHVFYSCGVYLLARRFFDEPIAVAAGLFAALPLFLFPYSSLGGYTEAIALFPWILLLYAGIRASENREIGPGVHPLVSGLLCGLALWIMPIAFPFILAFFISLHRAAFSQRFRPVFAGFCLATLPTILYNLKYPAATFLRLFSRPTGLDRTALMTKIESGGLLALLWETIAKWLESSYRALLDVPEFTLALFGISRQATLWEQTFGAVILAVFVFGIWRLFKDKTQNRFIAEFFLWTILINYVFFIFFGMNRYRYLIPVLIAVPFGLSLGVAWICERFQIKARSIMVVIVLLIHLLFNFVRAPGHRYVEEGVIEYLEAKGLSKGYANYFIAYPLNYLSNERLLYSPAFHTPSHDRYDAYTERVARADTPAFIFDDRSQAEGFREALKQMNISANEDDWHSYTIFYGLDHKIKLGLLRTIYQSRRRNDSKSVN